MKKGLSLWVYDVAMNRYLRLNLKEDLSEIRKAYAAFKYESNFPWKVIVLCDKNEDVVLSFCDSSLHQDMEKHNSFYARKYLEYLLTHEVKLGCFAVDDKVTFSNLILTLIKKVEVYNFECENIRKKKAKQNFKKAIQLLYEYACIHSEVEVFEKKDQHYQIFKKDLDPYRFINENWKTEMQELLSIFSDESQEAYLSAAWQAMQTTKKEFIRIEFDFNRKLTEIQNKLILQAREKLLPYANEWEKMQFDEELQTYLDVRRVPAYWLWKSFKMSRDTYPKVIEKGLENSISDEEIYAERNKEFGARDFEVKYFMNIYDWTTDEVFEKVLDLCWHMENGVEVFDKKVLAARVNREVYRGYIGLLKRDAFIQKYHEFIFGTDKKFLNPDWQKRVW